jgi:8-oxo-dGTP pyrophosphatase MutT (NUDIX family)
VPDVATPLPAATVVVVRRPVDGASAPFEVLLLRRSPAMTFVAGAHVFPGGRVDDADRLADPAASCDGLDAPRRFPHLEAAAELALRVGAVRELVEEAGVLLARRRGSWATSGEAEELRRQLGAGVAFEDCLTAGGWRLALGAVVPFSRIVTPRSEPRRFDTHFFLAELPAGRTARPDAAESDELVWATPARALELGSRGDVVLLPPTWATLLLLSSFESADAMLAWARSRTIERIEPVLTLEPDGRRTISMPAAAAGAAAGARARPPLRFALVEGTGWRPAG